MKPLFSYKLVNKKESYFGYKRIDVLTFIPYRTIISKFKKAKDGTWPDGTNRRAHGDYPNGTEIHGHEMNAICLCDGEINELQWDELFEETLHGIYQVIT